MTIDDRNLNALIEESQDLQVDAMSDIKATLPELEQVREERRWEGINLDEIARFNAGRRALLRRLGLGTGGLAARGAFAGGFGSLLAGILATPAHAQAPLDVQILQTAASLENLAVATYNTALGLDFIKNGNKTVVAFAQITMQQHAAHGRAFNAQAKTLGGQEQSQPNPRFLQVVEQEKPKLTSPPAVVRLAKKLETVATETYLQNTTQLENTTAKSVMASVMGVETQHAATLAAVEALLGAPNANELIQVPFPAANLSKLPAAAGSVAFPEAMEPAKKENVADPESGAVK